MGGSETERGLRVADRRTGVNGRRQVERDNARSGQREKPGRRD